MAIDVNGQAPPTVPMRSVPSALYRPARPDNGPGRWFRMCVGIREDVLDWAPSERPRYTGLGIIVLNTGCLAAFAMFTALGKVLAAPAVALILIALVWGWMIFSVDRWLITSTHGIHGLNRLLIFLPRLGLAVLLAFTIAEPLTLRIFQNTLVTQVQTTRTTQLASYESQLQTCNPVTGLWNGSTVCDDYHLTVANPPYAVQQKLTTAKQQQAALQSAVSTDQAEQEKLTSIAEGECAGTAGPDMSGSVGDGARCGADWAAEAKYVRQSGLETKLAQLAALQETVNGLIQQAGSVQQTYALQLHSAITNAVAERKNDLGQIGILDEWTALQQLSAQSSFVFFGHWLLVLVLLALDCLPVLAKLMSESSAYDQLLADQLASDERVHQTDLRLREETATVDKEVAIYLAEVSKRDRMRNVERDERVRNALGDTDGLDDVRLLAAQWIQEAKTGQ
jgi:Domain of unknown function (DUF4407)